MRHLARTLPIRVVSGFSLVELLVAMTILVMILMGVVTTVYHESQALSSQAQMAFRESAAQQLLARIEQELAFAQGAVPKAWLSITLGSAQTTAQVDTTLGFPDQGVLLVDRGSLEEERISYTGFDPVLNEFTGLTRGEFCTTASTHVWGGRVIWAGLAEPIENQTAPPADQWDGVASELSGPTFFRGDGTGFSFRVPTDLAGGDDFIVGGEITWGATIDGQPNLNGWAVITFEPVAEITEQDRGRDFNRDGDRVDTFDLGRMRWRSWDVSDPAQPATDVALCAPIVLQERCNWGGDLNADGFDDPIFLWDPGTRNLHIRLLVLVGTINSMPVFQRLESAMYLRNSSAN